MMLGLLGAAALLLQPNSALTFEATIPEGENVVVSLGRGREKLVVSSKDDAYPWSYPEPAYDVTLRNRAVGEKGVALSFASRSYDGVETTHVERTVTVAAGGEKKVRIEVPVKKFGWHSVTLTEDGVPYERHDAKGETSRPSAPFKFLLKNNFAEQ